ncbi:unnamed protein product [Strongylus vulgaris]|uniref:Uncharacterized protein n=1 Tax=Strongylus vulgaris TaxID=40348 RepID=A0A3P7IM80_STRVU|nr:unnamed protein product [Strongylus vulgaris]
MDDHLALLFLNLREVDGTLRTATPEEHDRMNRTYYEKPNRPVFPPPVFEDPYLQDALDRKEHEFVLDWACWFFEPDDPAYVKLVQCIFDRVIEKGDFDVLHSTRHFGTMVFYLALNGNIPPLLNFFGGRGRLHDCANLVRLQKTLHPDWRFVINTGDSDLKIVTDFMKQVVLFSSNISLLMDSSFVLITILLRCSKLSSLKTFWLSHLSCLSASHCTNSDLTHI